jgi:hypothetical protein
MNASQAVTAQYDFCKIGDDSLPLFSVRAGVPLALALEQLSALHSSTHAAIELMACEKDVDSIPGALWQAAHLMDFQFALIQAIQNGLFAHGNATSKGSKS